MSRLRKSPSAITGFILISMVIGVLSATPERTDVEDKGRIISFARKSGSLDYFDEASRMDSKAIDRYILFFESATEYELPLAIHLLTNIVRDLELDETKLKKIRSIAETRKLPARETIDSSKSDPSGALLSLIDRRISHPTQASHDPLALPTFSKTGDPAEQQLRILMRALPLMSAPDEQWLKRFDKLDESRTLDLLQKWLATAPPGGRSYFVKLIGIALERFKMPDVQRAILIKKLIDIHQDNHHGRLYERELAYLVLVKKPDSQVVDMIVPVLRLDDYSRIETLLPALIEAADRTQLLAIKGGLEGAKLRLAEQNHSKAKSEAFERWEKRIDARLEILDRK